MFYYNPWLYFYEICRKRAEKQLLHGRLNKTYKRKWTRSDKSSVACRGKVGNFTGGRLRKITPSDSRRYKNAKNLLWLFPQAYTYISLSRWQHYGRDNLTLPQSLSYSPHSLTMSFGCLHCAEARGTGTLSRK